MERWRLDWDRGRAEVIASGAMLHDVVFRLEDGRSVRPFVETPWRGERDIEEDAGLPAHLRHLGGEWPCVPFGTSPADPGHHGYGSNAEWELVGRDDAGLSLACDFPADHAVERLQRTVRAVPGEAALEMTLSVRVRRDAALPIGLHPIFRLPDEDGGLRLEPGPFSAGQVFPETFQPGVSRLAPGVRFESLARVATADGGETSIAALPSPSLREELVQLWNLDGRMELLDAASGIRLRLSWDPAHFPHCLLWISQGGRTARPWNGRFRGLGVEPVASAFDRADLASAALEPGGWAQAFRAGETWTTHYRLEAL